MEIKDLKPGMKLKGTVRKMNQRRFGSGDIDTEELIVR